MPTTLDDIASWVQNDILKRTGDTDIQAVCRSSARDFYKTLCAKVPFDELMVTSKELPLTVGKVQYGLGNDLPLQPELRAISNIRITFDSSNSRRLRRSHIRVYDSMALVRNTRPASYARWGNTIELNNPPDAVYTVRLRYWCRPPIGHTYTITNMTWAASVVTLTMASTTGISAGHSLVLQGCSPQAANGSLTALVVTGTTVTATLTTNPGTYIGGGYLFNTSSTDFQNTYLVTPVEWDELIRQETLYKVYYALDQLEKAMNLMQPAMIPRQPSSKRTLSFEVGIIPRLWNDLLTTVSQQENVDEDFSINPTMRNYSTR